MKYFSEQLWEFLSSLWHPGDVEGEKYDKDEARSLLRDQYMIRQAMCRKGNYDVSAAWKRVEGLTSPKRWRVVSVMRYASVVLVASVLGYYWLRPEEPVGTMSIVPGMPRAELVMVNGERIVLDSCSKTWDVAELGVQVVNHDARGVLRYRCDSTDADKRYELNQLSVPKGGEYSLELPDGSVVWLNSESSLKFPVQFADDSRDVHLEGEAFFEVAGDPDRPFRIHFADKEITVLGTRFNVSAYESDDMWHATLVEGSIHLASGQESITLKPSEQYVMNRDSKVCELRVVDTELYTSWVDGKIYFKGFTFEEIVNKLERWYDFSMFYQNEEIKRRRFSGVINKHRSLEEILKFLEQTTNVRFEIKGKTVIASQVE